MTPMPPMGNRENERQTPHYIFDPLNERFDFTIDAAASHANALVWKYATLHGAYQDLFLNEPESMAEKISDEDGLALPWATSNGLGHRARVWCNPPYGRGLLEPFVAKMHEEWLAGCIVVALLPCRTEQPWFHRYVIGDGARIEWIEKRVRYDGLKAGAPFPSMIVIWQ